MTVHTTFARLGALFTLAALGSCSGGPTGPGRDPKPIFASCDETYQSHQPNPPLGHDLFVTPAERAQAQAQIDRLTPIQDRHSDELFAIPGVIGTGIGYLPDRKEWVFVVSYDQALVCPTTVPARLEGVRVLLDPSSPAVALDLMR